MSKMEQSSGDKRREENIRKNREFVQVQIALTRIAGNDVESLPEKEISSGLC